MFYRCFAGRHMPSPRPFRGVYAHDKEVGVAVVKGIILRLIALGAVVGVGERELEVKEIGVLKIEFADRLGEIRDEAAVIVVARRHHIWQALDYPL